MPPIMLNRVLHANLGLSWKNFLSLAILVSGGLIWFSISSTVLEEITSHLSYNENLLILIISAASTAMAAVIGAFLPRGSANLRFLKIWMASGAVASIIPLIIDVESFLGVIFVTILWGATLGIGMPASMEYLTKATVIENRGRVGALAYFATFAGIFVSGMVLGPLDYRTQLGVLGILKFAGLIVFLLLNPSERPARKKTLSYLTIVRERSFLLYFSAWIMFALVNYLSIPILSNQVDAVFGKDFANSSATIEAMITAVFALVGGVLCDTVGRKLVAVSGFIMLGLGYATLGLFPLSFLGWAFYTAVDGAAWGMLGVVFFMTLWGDLAHENSSKKYYALGSLPLLLSSLLQEVVAPDLAASVSFTNVFSLASLFLFLAILPLLYAPETLPEKTMKARELRQYVERAKKVKGNYTRE